MIKWSNRKKSHSTIILFNYLTTLTIQLTSFPVSRLAYRIVMHHTFLISVTEKGRLEFGNIDNAYKQGGQSLPYPSLFYRINFKHFSILICDKDKISFHIHPTVSTGFYLSLKLTAANNIVFILTCNN